jgi:hypothetical protein
VQAPPVIVRSWQRSFGMSYTDLHFRCLTLWLTIHRSLLGKSAFAYLPAEAVMAFQNSKGIDV